MATIPFIDLAFLAQKTGFPGGQSQANVIAIIDQESGRNPDVVNENEPDPSNISGGITWSAGLGQVNEVHTVQGGLLEGWTKEELLDPERNMQAMFIISNSGRTFTPWSVFNSGLYTKSLPPARVALDATSRIKSLQNTNTYLRSEIDRVNIELKVAKEETLRVQTELNLQINKMLEEIEAYKKIITDLKNANISCSFANSELRNKLQQINIISQL